MYYVMDCDGPYPPTDIIESPQLAGGPWMTGNRVTIDVPESLIYTLDPDRPGNIMPFYEESIPIMRDDLIDALQAAGVDNLELFQAILRDTREEKEYANYKAVNIVGAISCADMSQSDLMGTTDSTMIDVDFDSLVIDESKTGGALLFRLAEAVNAVIVHENVKNQVEKAGIAGMDFLEPEDWAG